ncbi:MAG: hypothetical protein NTNFB02_20830 [Nitrospira sp.]
MTFRSIDRARLTTVEQGVNVKRMKPDLTDRMRKGMACALILLFVGLSFNAYACLLPVSSVVSSKMDNGCSTPDEQPARQICDAFKTLGLQSVTQGSASGGDYALWSQDTLSFSLLIGFAAHRGGLYDRPTERPPQDLLLKISVLRI